MSEKIYLLLLGLYPSHFREAYGDEALQLFRDRLRDEQGFAAKVRLWCDLLADLAISLPQEHHRSARPSFAAIPAQNSLPSFHVLEGGSPRPEAFFLGAALSILALTAISTSMTWATHSDTTRLAVLRDVTPPALKSAASGTASSRSHATRGGQPAESSPGKHNSPQPMRQTASTPAPPTTGTDASERQRVLDAVVANLNHYYFDHRVAQKTGEALVAHAKNGDDNAATQDAAFAALLTAQMRQSSGDMHLVVEYSENPLPSAPPEQTPEAAARFRAAMLQQHCMIRKAEILPHNIGYLKLDFFPDESVCGSDIRQAMASLNHARAIIIDLRDNAGGSPDTVSLAASYLFDHPEYMYSPRGAPTTDSWTHSPVAGNNLADKPAYILTSSTTWSGAEQFSYNMKMLKRATLVGETTRGGAHAGVFHRIDDHFGIGIPEQRSINPYSKADWEGVGVTPDVKVPAADAFNTAVRLAEARLQQK